MKPDNTIHNGAFINDLIERCWIGALGREVNNLRHGFFHQCVPQWGERVDEGAARHMKTHDLHQHLV